MCIFFRTCNLSYKTLIIIHAQKLALSMRVLPNQNTRIENIARINPIRKLNQNKKLSNCYGT